MDDTNTEPLIILDETVETNPTPALVPVKNIQTELRRVGSTIHELKEFNTSLKGLHNQTVTFRTKFKFRSYSRLPTNEQDTQFQLNHLLKKTHHLEILFSEMKKDLDAARKLLDKLLESQVDKNGMEKLRALRREIEVFKKTHKAIVDLANLIYVDMINSSRKKIILMLLTKLKSFGLS